MNVARAILLAVLSSGILIAAPVRGQDLSTWTELTPQGGGFSIRMPGIPTQETDRETKARQFENRSGDRRYFVSYRELSADEKKASKVDPAVTLEKARDAFIQPMPNAVLRDSRTAPVGDAPGLVWTYDTQAENVPPIRIRGDMVLAKGRLYTLIYADRKYAFDEEGPAHWFETFRLIP
ncbi:MAG: hypothetical protein M3167_06800 [Acidobacteriota bacterium]|nr:hypothetical protein [Acidobacteriota bacterium]